MRLGAISHLLVVFAVLLGLTAAQPAPGNQMEKEPTGLSALVFTDANLEDLAALYIIGRQKTYKKVVVVITGVDATKKAHAAIQGFLQGAMESEYDFKHKFSVLFGDNPAARAALHEATWDRITTLPRESGAPKYNHDTLVAALGDQTVDVFQIAPVSKKDSSILVDLPQLIKIRMFHITHGYNTRRFEMQTGEDLGEVAQNEFVSNLQSHLRQGESNREAVVVVTDDSLETWRQLDGGTLSLKVLKQYFPAEYIDAAFWNPSTLQQFENVAVLAGEQGQELLQDNIKVSLLPEAWSKVFSNKVLAKTLRKSGYKNDALSAMQYAQTHTDNALGEELKLGYRSLISKSILPFLEELKAGPEGSLEAARLWHQFKQYIEPVFEKKGAVNLQETVQVAAVLHAIRWNRLESLTYHIDKQSGLAYLKAAENDDKVHGSKLKPLAKHWANANIFNWIQMPEKLIHLP
ncbi:hypothetical protein ACQY0O_005611 [Thecaphora frezii]